MKTTVSFLTDTNVHLIVVTIRLKYSIENVNNKFL